MSVELYFNHRRIEGATIALLSRTKREALEKTVAREEHCRLETDPEFSITTSTDAGSGRSKARTRHAHVPAAQEDTGR